MRAGPLLVLFLLVAPLALAQGAGPGQATKDANLPEPTAREADLRPLVTRLADVFAARDTKALLELGLEGVQGGRLLGAAGTSSTEETQLGILGADFDGDGLGDALLLEIQPQLALHARRGLDGAPLWSRALAPASYGGAPLPDVDGDGAEDLLLVRGGAPTWSESRDCSLAACRTTYAASWQWGVGVLSGATGSVRWEETHDAEYVESFDEPIAGPATQSIRTRHAGMLLSTGGGHLVTNFVDLSYTRTVASVPAGYVAPETVEASTRATAQDLLDGSVRVAREATATSSVAQLHVVGQLGGDEAADLVWEVPEVARVPEACVPLCTPGSLTLLDQEALDGATGATLWSKPRLVSGEPVALAPAGDVDGDGAADWLSAAARFLAIDHALVSGATGEALWTREAHQAMPLGGGLVLLAETSHRETPVLELARVDANGAILLRTQHAPAAEASWSRLRFEPAGDADGDGVVDLIVNVFSCFCENVPSDTWHSVALVESGATGEALLREELDDDLLYFPTGDHDGDGRTEVLRFSWTPDNAARFAVRSLAAEQWAIELRGWIFTFEWVVVPDVDGDGSADVLLTTGTWSGNVIQKRIAAVRGPDGATLWELTQRREV